MQSSGYFVTIPHLELEALVNIEIDHTVSKTAAAWQNLSICSTGD